MVVEIPLRRVKLNRQAGRYLFLCVCKLVVLEYRVEDLYAFIRQKPISKHFKEAEGAWWEINRRKRPPKCKRESLFILSVRIMSS